MHVGVGETPCHQWTLMTMLKWSKSSAVKVSLSGKACLYLVILDQINPVFSVQEEPIRMRASHLGLLPGRLAIRIEILNQHKSCCFV